MTSDDLIRFAREAGLRQLENTPGFVVFLEDFAALVLANNPPQSSMAWQEGYVAGVTASREKFCAQLKQLHDSHSLQSDLSELRARKGMT